MTSEALTMKNTASWPTAVAAIAEGRDFAG